MTSWTKTSLPASSNWSDIAYGGGKFVAVSNSDKYAAYSTDGVNWNIVNLPIAVNKIAYGNGKFVATGSSRIIYSSDGINWLQATNPSSNVHSSIAYGNGKFVIMGGSGTLIASSSSSYYQKGKTCLYSTDGINWTETALPVEGSWGTFCFGGGKFVAVDWNGETRAEIYSTDGITWYKITLPYAAYWRGIAYGGGRFVLVAFNTTTSTDTTKYSLYSDDGLTWTYRNLPEAEHWVSVVYGSQMFLAISDGFGSSVYSLDGRTWGAGPTSGISYVSEMAFGNGRFVVIASQNSSSSAYILEKSLTPYTVYTSVSPTNSGTITGAGEYTSGTSVTVKATPSDGWEFVEWQENGTTVSTNASYTFTITADRTLTAVFKQKLTAWVGINGKARKGVEMYVGVNGKARKVTGAWIGVNGKARRFL